MFHPPPVDGASFALFIVLHSVRGERSLLDAYRIVVMPSKKRSTDDDMPRVCHFRILRAFGVLFIARGES